MYLRLVRLVNYKNYSDSTFQFQQRFVLINGKNGIGKTNLADAIYFLCVCKSYSTRFDPLCIRKENTFFRLEGIFENGIANQTIVCKYPKDGKKEFSKDGILYDRLSTYVGEIPAVMIAPQDIELIMGGSEDRRRFMDISISQMNSKYLTALLKYNKILMQRNKLLKNALIEKKIDQTLWNVLNFQLAEAGDFIYACRNNWQQTFSKIVMQFYQFLSFDLEPLEMIYKSALHQEKMLFLIEQSESEDLNAGRTTSGIHKDDLEFNLNGMHLKETGSQGQIKTYLLALKLAVSQMLIDETHKKPILLLDDVFEKLDVSRLNQLFKLIQKLNFDQIIITDADIQRGQKYFSEMGITFDHLILEHKEENSTFDEADSTNK